MAKKKLRPIVTYLCDVQFYGGDMKIKARTDSEARRKMWDRLKKNPKIMLKWINKQNSYVDKMW